MFFFGSNRPSSIRKHSNWVWIGIGGQKCPFLGEKYIFELFGILRLWSCFGLLDPFFHKISPQIPPNDDYSCCGHPLVTLMRVWVIIYAHNNHIIWIQFTKVSLKWSKFAKVIILCVKLIFLVPTDLFLKEDTKTRFEMVSMGQKFHSKNFQTNDTTITKILVNSSLNSQRALHQPFWDLESGNIV